MNMSKRYVNIYVYIYIIYIYICVCIYACMRVCLYACIYIYVCVCVCVCVCVYVYVYVYIYNVLHLSSVAWHSKAIDIITAKTFCGNNKQTANMKPWIHGKIIKVLNTLMRLQTVIDLWTIEMPCDISHHRSTARAA